ncbi:hypothetical protein NKH80_04155 [Mesorhizobium sp. M0904]|uniref:hypothetical protein n=1 Tax=unclassified Mesorhizobium TaxID=325217 RepID=UPI0033387EBD
MAGKRIPTGGNRNADHSSAPTASKSKLGLGLGGVEGADRCDIRIDTDLQGIRLPALVALKKGDILRVDIEFRDRHPVAVAIRSDGVIVGSFNAFEKYATFLECLGAGVRYSVEVTEIGSGHCHVVGGRTP